MASTQDTFDTVSLVDEPVRGRIVPRQPSMIPAKVPGLSWCACSVAGAAALTVVNLLLAALSVQIPLWTELELDAWRCRVFFGLSDVLIT